MYFLHAINSDRQTRLLNVLGQIAMILGDKEKCRIRTVDRAKMFFPWPAGLQTQPPSYSVATAGRGIKLSTHPVYCPG